MSGRRGAATALACIAVALAACGGAPASAPPNAAPTRPPGMTIDCGDVPEDACTVVAAEYGSDVGQVVELTVRCVARTCTVASGDVETGLRYASGRRMSHGRAWGAVQQDPGVPPAPPVAAPRPAPLCVGIARARCIEMAQAGDIPLGAPGVMTITVRCARRGCADSAGEGETVVRFVDGTHSTVGWTYGG